MVLRLSRIVGPAVCTFGQGRVDDEAGYRARLGTDVHVEVALFHNVHDNLSSFGQPVVTLVGTPRPKYAVATFPYVNGVVGSSDGFELAPEWRPGVDSALTRPGRTALFTTYRSEGDRLFVVLR